MFPHIEVDEDVTVRKHEGANKKKMRGYISSFLSLVLVLATMSACNTQDSRPVAIDEPDPDLYFVRGYRSEDDPCKLTGETAFTNQFLDDAADLVTCLTGYEGAAEFVRATGARLVTQTQSYTLYSVPRR